MSAEFGCRWSMAGKNFDSPYSLIELRLANALVASAPSAVIQTASYRLAFLLPPRSGCRPVLRRSLSYQRSRTHYVDSGTDAPLACRASGEATGSARRSPGCLGAGSRLAETRSGPGDIQSRRPREGVTICNTPDGIFVTACGATAKCSNHMAQDRHPRDRIEEVTGPIQHHRYLVEPPASDVWI